MEIWVSETEVILQTPTDAGLIRVGVVEDDFACRRALTEAINASAYVYLAWQAATLQEARGKLGQPLDVLVVDLGLPDGSGLELIGEVRHLQPACQVMVSTIFGDDANLISAITAGALGYLLKDVTASVVVEEIRSLYAGGSPINPMMARKLLQTHGMQLDTHSGSSSATAHDRDDTNETGRKALGLSLREAEVLKLVAHGYVLDEVAARMNISHHTARSFVRRIYQKLQVSSRAEAVRLAVQHGLLPED